MTNNQVDLLATMYLMRDEAFRKRVTFDDFLVAKFGDDYATKRLAKRERVPRGYYRLQSRSATKLDAEARRALSVLLTAAPASSEVALTQPSRIE